MTTQQTSQLPPDEYDIDEDRLFLTGVDRVEKSRKTYTDHIKRRKALIVGASVVGGLLVLGILLGLLYGLEFSEEASSYTCPDAWANEPADGAFFVIGDWGRQGSSSQKLAAKMMSEVAACMKPKFIISTGDNFYDHGLESADDPQIQESFRNVYTSAELQVPWYAVLGNHDYGDTLQSNQLTSCSVPAPKTLADCKPGCCFSPLWQVSGTGTPGSNLDLPGSNPDQPGSNLDARWRLQQGVHKVSFSDIGLDLDIIFLDTSPYISSYLGQPWAKVIGGVAYQDTVKQKAAFEDLLANSSARLKLVVGHHPALSLGAHCQNAANSECDEVAGWLRPMLKEYNGLAYFCGHEHDLQYISAPDDPITYVVSGAGSDVRPGEFDNLEPPKGANFFADDQGFVAVLVRKKTMTLYYYVSQRSQPAFEITIPVP